MSIVQLGYVGFGVSDLPRWEELATKVLGMAVSERTSDGLALRMDSFKQRLVLHESPADDLVYAGWIVPGPDDLAALRSTLEGQVEITNATPEELTSRAVRAMFWFIDPDGLRMEVAYGPAIAVDPFIPGRPSSGFKAEEQGIGHLVVRVDDRDKSEAFVTKALGLRLTDYGSGRLAFFHCNRRHHSIALAPRSALPGDQRLVHLMIEVNSLDDLGTAIDLCEQLGFEMAETLGKHVNDHVVSFYITTPSGFQIEFGFDGREVDEASWVVHSYTKRDVWGHKKAHK